MARNSHQTQAQIGDWLEVGGPPGTTPRRGQVLDVLGSTGNRRFRVRWDEDRGSLVYPNAGVTGVRATAPQAHKRDDHEAGA